MKESEAREKWCPFGFIHPVNSNLDGHCMGSDCMLWEPERSYWEHTPAGHPINVTEGGYCRMAKR